MDDDHILYEVTDKVAVITLNRPQRANAQTMEMLDDLDAAWSRAACDDEVTVIVLRASGKHFSSGHDLESGPRKAKEILFTGRAVTAREAEQTGMVNRVFALDRPQDAVFDIHPSGHGNAISRTGYPNIARADQMKEHIASP